MTKNYSDPFGFTKAINTNELDKLNTKQLNELMDILTPRMQKQLVDSLHNNEGKQ